MLTASEMTCVIDAIYEYLFPPVEQAKIVSLGNNLQQIAVSYKIAIVSVNHQLSVMYVHAYCSMGPINSLNTNYNKPTIF